MRFFIPLAARKLEYTKVPDKPKYDLGPNLRDAGWAWAAVRFGFTPDEYDRLTTAQLALLAKADEQRFVQLGTAIRDAVANAIANTHRKKGKRAIPLYKKVSHNGDHMDKQQALKKMAAIQARFGGES